MIKRNKKGFTLIEILAVILIIGVIALISTPIIINIINDAKKETFKNSSLNVFKAAQLYETKNNFKKISNDGISIANQSLPFENGNFTSGKIIRNESNLLEIVNLTDGTYCAKGTKNNLIVIKGSCDKFDITAPVNTTITTDNITSHSFRVIVTSEDLESGIKNYSYSIDGTNYVTTTSNNYTFNKLSMNKSYTIYVQVTNNNGITTEVIKEEVNTKELNEPTYSIDKSGWQIQKIVTIIYPERETGFVYSYSIDGGDTWTILENGTTVNVTFTTNGNIIARIYDGTNYKAASSYLVSGIDTTAPSASVELYNKTTNTITVKGAGTDFESGVTKYEFSIDNGTYINNGINDTYTFTSVKEGSHTVRVRITNGSGLLNESEELVVSPNDITVPTYSIDKSGWQTQKIVTINYPARQTGFVYQYSINGGSSWTTVSSGVTGTVTFTSNGDVIARVYDGTNYKTASSYTVTQIDTTAPSASVALSSKTTNTITVKGSGADAESGVTKYEFSIDGGSYVSNGTTDTYTFTGVTTGSHTVRVRVTNGSGLSTESTGLTVSPNDITVPTYSIDKSGWQTQKIVTINYPARQTGFVYQYSINGGSSWTTVSSGVTGTVTLTSNGSVIARVYDGTNYKTASTYTVSQIDTTVPTYTSYEIKNITGTGYDVYVYGVTDVGSGVNRVQFPTWTEKNGQDDIQSNWPVSSTAAGINQGNGTWYYRVNVSEHNGEAGNYITHVYIYDNVGNSKSISINQVTVPLTGAQYTLACDTQAKSSAASYGNSRGLWCFNACNSAGGSDCNNAGSSCYTAGYDYQYNYIFKSCCNTSCSGNQDCIKGCTGDTTAPTVSATATSDSTLYNTLSLKLNVYVNDNLYKPYNFPTIDWQSRSDNNDFQLYISNTGYGVGGNWESYKSNYTYTSKPWTVNGDYDGITRKIYIQIMDGAGNIGRYTLNYTIPTITEINAHDYNIQCQSQANTNANNCGRGGGSNCGDVYISTYNSCCATKCAGNATCLSICHN